MQQITAFLATRGDLLLLVAVFLAVGSLTFAFGTITTSWSGVRRRVSAAPGPAVPTGPSVTASVQRRSGPDYLRGFVPTDEAKKSALVKFLNSAGYYGDSTLVWFQAIRVGTALLFGVATSIMFGRPYAAGTSTVMKQIRKKTIFRP